MPRFPMGDLKLNRRPFLEKLQENMPEVTAYRRPIFHFRPLWFEDGN
jgi:hypothetical protein